MRVVFALLAALFATAPVGAVTIITGTINLPAGGFLDFDSSAPDPPFPSFGPPGTSRQISLKIEGGTFVGGNVEVWNHFDYFDFVDHPPFDEGEDLIFDSICALGGGSNCSDIGGLKTAVNPRGTKFLDNFVSSPTSLSYTATRLRDFGALNGDFSSCIPPVLNSVCAVRSSGFFTDIFTKVKADGPVSYTITFGDPVAVPEAPAWIMMIAGFGLAAAMLRRTKSRSLALGQTAGQA